MATLFHRVLLVLCVDAFRCLQLSPCRGTRRVRSSKRHGMKWRCLGARRKVQYYKSALICLCISKLFAILCLYCLEAGWEEGFKL